MESSNVVQVEFFHPFGYPHLKTTVRLHDRTGKLTRLALTAVKIESEANRLIERYASYGPIRKWFVSHRVQRLAGALVKLRERAPRTAQKCLSEALAVSPEKVAVEKNDRSFRFCQKDEVQSLKEASWHSDGVWLFVFFPNQLLSKDNKPVARLM